MSGEMRPVESSVEGGSPVERRTEPKAASPWRELRNKLQVYRLVASAGPRLAAAGSLAEGVRRAYGLGPYPALWAVEGLGVAWADAAWERGDDPDFLLAGPGREELPAESLLMLHAGAGMAWSRRLLRRMRAAGAGGEGERLLEELVAFCRAHSRPGYTGAALEGLGMVARLFFPRRVDRLSRHLAEMGDELAGAFWHGAGRSQYFLRPSFLPTWGAFRRALDRARREPPGEAERANAGAGLAWAVTLVNMRHPEIVAQRLVELARAAGEAVVANGVTSAAVVREDTTPGSSLLADFGRWQPPAGAVERWWRERVPARVEEARTWFHPALAAEGLLAEVFRYQDLQQLAERRSS